MRRVARREVAVLAFATVLAFFGSLAARADAAQVSSVLGIPCTTQSNGVQACIGDTAHRVHSWDGVPLDVNIWLPPASQDGPFPLLAYHHGWGGNKGGSGADPTRALDGYVVMSYTARGFGESCGSVTSRAADPVGCAKGWIHLDDARFEARDTQTLAGKLVDLKLVKAHRIGVTGVSYGGGVSYELAMLRNRVMRPDGTLKRWRSPNGKKMKISAAVPLWGWSDLAHSLMPNGNTLDYLVHNPYGSRIGVAKQSYQNLLFAAGAASGFYAPVGVDPDADIQGWFARIQAGEPYDDPLSESLLEEIQQHHSPYYISSRAPSGHKGHWWWRGNGHGKGKGHGHGHGKGHGHKHHGHRHWWRSKRVRPAPILAYNSWLDDLFYGDEPLRLRNLILDRHPKADFSLLLAAGAGHPRAGGPSPAELGQLTTDFFDHHLKGEGEEPDFGVRTYSQACNGSTQMGPLDTRTWRGQHPGEVRIYSSAPQTFTGLGGNPAIATGLDIIAAGACPIRPAALEPNTATYDGGSAQNGGYTMIGSPTVIARLTASGSNAQVSARLWDVAPDGTQAFITRGTFRPAAGTKRVVFQLHPNGWHFAPGHFPRLQLLGRDAPYQRASNGEFVVTVRDLQLRIPVRQRPGKGQVRWPGWPLDRDGTFARPWEIAWR